MDLNGTFKGMRTFGMDENATDGFDKGIDDLVPPPEPGSSFEAYFAENDPPPLDKLSVDIKALAEGKGWVFVIIAPEKQNVTVSWDPSLFPNEMNDSFQELDPVTGDPIGPRIDMRDETFILVEGGEFSPEIKVFGMEMNVSLNHPPHITSEPETTAQWGSLYTYNVEAEDPDGDELLYSLLKAPPGMVIDPDTGLIEWQVPPPGLLSAAPFNRVNVTAEVSDSLLTDQQSWTISILPTRM
jgi:hypothetical protein